MKNQFCPRCSAEMICNFEDIQNCDCRKISLSAETISFLRKTYWDCLCNECLAHFDNLILECSKAQPSSNLIEGFHYYLEGSLMVFTEQFHYLKGKCCGSNCRHCVYGFNSNKL